jgi:hypothetical protein
MFLLSLVCSTFVLSQAVPPSGSPATEANRQHEAGFLKSPPLSYSQSEPAINAGQKFQLAVLNTVTPYQLVISAAQAGFSQAIDSNPGFGQGAEGFGKRFGAAYADKASSEMFSTFLFPSLLRQDPRYFRMGPGSGKSRAWYAISRILVTRNDSGNNAPNYSLWMGSLASGGLSNVYYADEDRGIGLTFSRAGISIGSTAAFNLVREFWPDIKHKVFHKTP